MANSAEGNSEMSCYGFGGAVYNHFNSKITSVIADFIGNFATTGGAIDNLGTISMIQGDFIGNHAVMSGGEIENRGIIGEIEGIFANNIS